MFQPIVLDRSNFGDPRWNDFLVWDAQRLEWVLRLQHPPPDRAAAQHPAGRKRNHPENGEC